MGSYAIMLNADTESIGPTANALEYAIDLDENGHEVDLYFDGVATQWPGTLSEKPEHPVNEYFEEADERDLIGGACSYCANAFGGTEGVQEAGIELLGGDGHGPDIGELATDGVDIITVG